MPKNWCFCNYGGREDSWRVPWTARRSNQSILKEISPEYSLEGQCWSWSSNTLATWCEELTYWKRPWCWERLKAGGEEDDRGWDGWMASPTRRTWVWASFASWWWIGRPGMLQSMEVQRVGHDWATELNWTDKTNCLFFFKYTSKKWGVQISHLMCLSFFRLGWVLVARGIFCCGTWAF